MMESRRKLPENIPEPIYEMLLFLKPVLLHVGSVHRRREYEDRYVLRYTFSAPDGKDRQHSMRLGGKETAEAVKSLLQEWRREEPLKQKGSTLYERAETLFDDIEEEAGVKEELATIFHFIVTGEPLRRKISRGGLC